MLRVLGLTARFCSLAKIVFTYILGYQVDIGHMEAVNLISSSKYPEKQMVSSSSSLPLALI